MDIVEAVEELIASIEGELEEGSAPLVAMVTALARAARAKPNNAALFRELRATIVELKKAAAGGEVDEDTQDFLVTIRAPVRTPVGDAEDCE